MKISFTPFVILFLIQGLFYLFLTFLSCFHFQRRSRFWLRFSISIVLFSFLCLLIQWIQFPIDFRIIVFLRYFLMLAFGFFCIYFCFDLDISNALFLSNTAFDIRHCIYIISLTISDIIDYFTEKSFSILSFPSWGIRIASIIVCVPFIAFFVHFCYKRRDLKTNIASITIFCFFSIVLSNVLNLFQLGVTREGDISALLFAFYAFNLISLISIIFLIFFEISHNELEREKDRIYQIQQLESRQYQIYKENIDIINIKCHDLRHQIREMKNSQSSLSKEDLNNIENEIRIYDTKVKSGNENVDFILQEKSLFCNKNGIILNCIIDGKLLSFLKDSELFSLLGNILDNAIDSCLKIENQNERNIIIKIHKALGGILIYEQNPYVGEIRYENGLPLSDKEDKKIHGYGMKSIKMIVENYNGTLTIKSENHFYSITIFFPLSEKKN